MPVPLHVRRTRFARLVKRVLEDAGAAGLTIPQVVERTGVSKSAFYRWRAGEWTKDPRASEVRAFFDGLGVPARLAYQALDWSDPAAQEQAPEVPLEPEIQEILRKLRDPNTPESEKRFLRESIRMLAARNVSKPSGRRSAG
ncbi:helix-turn-helix domain-containing protein [Rhizomonospora bruguierae]|uniref:helix-turn-helix domain-containing protein n=1 Tax=Rhizomonospora bruguierae TaxID=1581705 RepID=UPI001BCD2DD0|nr:helix-turn-helix transcriptional regulator [Micromonospora sp. NBRC 107566]